MQLLTLFSEEKEKADKIYSCSFIDFLLTKVILNKPFYYATGMEGAKYEGSMVMATDKDASIRRVAGKYSAYCDAPLEWHEVTLDSFMLIAAMYTYAAEPTDAEEFLSNIGNKLEHIGYTGAKRQLTPDEISSLAALYKAALTSVECAPESFTPTDAETNTAKIYAISLYVTERG